MANSSKQRAIPRSKRAHGRGRTTTGMKTSPTAEIIYAYGDGRRKTMTTSTEAASGEFCARLARRRQCPRTDHPRAGRSEPWRRYQPESGRHVGDDPLAVAKNRALVSHRIGPPAVAQAGRRYARRRGRRLSGGQKSDGSRPMRTFRPDRVACAVMTADCLPGPVLRSGRTPSRGQRPIAGWRGCSTASWKKQWAPWAFGE